MRFFLTQTLGQQTFGDIRSLTWMADTLKESGKCQNLVNHSYLQKDWKKIKLDAYNYEKIASKYGLRNYFLQDLDKVKEHTDMFIWNRCMACLWREMGTFLSGMMQCKSAATPTLSLGFNTTIEAFQMRYCMIFYL